MKPDYPRLQVRVTEAQHSRIMERVRERGITISDYLTDLIIADLDGHKDYMVGMIGHRMMHVSVMMTAMLKAQVNDAEFARIRGMSAKLSAGVFGPLPMRPFDLPEDLGAEEDIAALHEILSRV